MAKVDTLTFESVGACYKCTSHRYAKCGYLDYNVKDRREYLHRVLYENIHGPIPENHHLHHLCENKWCLNTSHLVCMPKEEHFAHHNKTLNSIAQIHPKHGLLNVWPSAEETRQAGFNPAHVKAVCRGVRDTHADCWWMEVRDE